MQDLYSLLCSYQNLFLAYKKARKGKTQRQEVIEFEKDLILNLQTLQNELINHNYFPEPLKCFVISDPKTRKIHKSAFRDRIVHHALCNIIQPHLEKCFIYDSYANQIDKGTLKAIARFDCFKKKVSKNNTKKCFVLKADIKHYFENVDHKILIKILKQKILDKRILALIRIILINFSSIKGMPLGNLTSQFFANVYLNELDQYVKHILKVKYYIRYVDDFVILSNNLENLEYIKTQINLFLNEKLNLELHPEKTKIINLNQGISFLGTKIFFHHKILLRKNRLKFQRKYQLLQNSSNNFDEIYDFMEGWLAYVRNFNTFNHELKILNQFQKDFQNEISLKEVNRIQKACRKV